MTAALNYSDDVCPVAPRDATPERATTSADLYAGTAGAPENTRDTAFRTDVDTVFVSTVFASILVVRATDDLVSDVVAFDEPVGITREIPPSAATAAGATTIIAKKHVNSFFITLDILYHKNSLIYNKKYPAIAGYFLFTQAQLFNQGFVIIRITFLDIGQQFFTTVNHHQQTTFRMIIFVV